MSDLQARFETAVADSKQLAKRPGDETLLKLYGYFKQATEGDVQGDRPSMFDFKGVAKYEAWSKLQGTSAEDAMQAYVDLIEELKNQ